MIDTGMSTGMGTGTGTIKPKADTGSFEPKKDTGSFLHTSTAADIPIGVLRPPSGGLFPVRTEASYRRRAWDPAVYALAVVAEFGASGWQACTIPPPPSDPAAIAAEIRTLVKKAEGRQEMAQQIKGQADGASLWWADLLTMTPQSHPATWDLMMIANAAGHMAVMHYKLMFNRARPSQVYPALMPPMMVPGHPSYPSGHAAESCMVAECLKLAIPALAGSAGQIGPLDLLARLIADNREIAGFHYPSDTEAGFGLGVQLVEALKKGPLFNEVVEAAAAEWGDVAG